MDEQFRRHMQQWSRSLTVVISIWLNLPGIAQAAENCSITNADWVSSDRPAVCLTGNIIGIPILLEDHQKAGVIGASDIYAGIYATPNLSLHAGDSRISSKWLAGRDDSAHRRDRGFLFAQIGHPLNRPAYSAIGLLPLPFGIGLVKSDRLFGPENLPPEDISLKGWRATSRIRSDLRLEIGAGSETTHPDRSKVSPLIVSLRATKLFDLLGGTKILASARGPRDGKNFQVGMATIFFSGRRHTSLEWIRRVTTSKTRQATDTIRVEHLETNDALQLKYFLEIERSKAARAHFMVEGDVNGNLDYIVGAEIERSQQPSIRWHATGVLGLRYGFSKTVTGDEAL